MTGTQTVGDDYVSLVLAQLGDDAGEAQRAERLALADQQQRVRELSPIEMPALPAVLGRRSETDVTVAAQAGDRDVLEALGRYRADVTRRESENAGRLRRCLWLLGVFRSDGSDYADRLEQWIRGRFRVPAGIELPTDPVGRRQCAGPLTRDYAILPRAWRQL